MSGPEIQPVELKDGREVKLDYLAWMSEVRGEYSAVWPTERNYSEAVQLFDADESIDSGSHTQITYDMEGSSLEDIMRNENWNPWFLAKEELKDTERAPERFTVFSGNGDYCMEWREGNNSNFFHLNSYTKDLEPLLSYLEPDIKSGQLDELRGHL